MNSLRPIIPETLSPKRFIPMLIVMLIGALGFLFNLPYHKYYTTCIEGLDTRTRSSLVYFFSVVIGIFHGYFIGRDKRESAFVILKSQFGMLDSILSAAGYGVIVNSSLNLLVGFLKEQLGIKNFFVDANGVDYWSYIIVVLLLLVWSLFRQWKLVAETVFIKTHSTVIVTSIPEDSN